VAQFIPIHWLDSERSELSQYGCLVRLSIVFSEVGQSDVEGFHLVSNSPENSFDPQDGSPEVEPQEDATQSADQPTSDTPDSGVSDSGDGAASDSAPDADASETQSEDVAEPVTDSETSDKPVPAPRKKSGKRGPVEEVADDDAPADEQPRQWYILKVQSNREKSICANLIRRVKMADLEDYFGEILVPTEDLVEYKNGKKKVSKQKLYPGYIVVHMAINDDTWFLVRETGGIGDFTGAGGRPMPMETHEIERILKKAGKAEEEQVEEVKTNIRFKIGEHVRITEGTFENFEGDVETIDETNGRVTVMINIFGRTTPVEMEHWQMEPV